MPGAESTGPQHTPLCLSFSPRLALSLILSVSVSPPLCHLPLLFALYRPILFPAVSSLRFALRLCRAWALLSLSLRRVSVSLSSSCLAIFRPLSAPLRLCASEASIRFLLVASTLPSCRCSLGGNHRSDYLLLREPPRPSLSLVHPSPLELCLPPSFPPPLSTTRACTSPPHPYYPVSYYLLLLFLQHPVDLLHTVALSVYHFYSVQLCSASEPARRSVLLPPAKYVIDDNMTNLAESARL